MRGLGLAAVAFFLSHVAYHWRFGDMNNALWACHVASLLIGIGALTNRNDVTAIGVLWLVVGIPMWFLHLASGGEFIPTSVFTHGGGAIVGAAVIHQQRWPRGGWWKACVALFAWVGLTRLVTPPELNVNLAFRIPGPTTSGTISHAQYLGLMAAVMTTIFLVADLLLRRALPLRSCDQLTNAESPLCALRDSALQLSHLQRRDAESAEENHQHQ